MIQRGAREAPFSFGLLVVNDNPNWRSYARINLVARCGQIKRERGSARVGGEPQSLRWWLDLPDPPLKGEGAVLRLLRLPSDVDWLDDRLLSPPRGPLVDEGALGLIAILDRRDDAQPRALAKHLHMRLGEAPRVKAGGLLRREEFHG